MIHPIIALYFASFTFLLTLIFHTPVSEVQSSASQSLALGNDLTEITQSTSSLQAEVHPAPSFQTVHYGLQTGLGLSPAIHAANTTAIQRAVRDAGSAGGGVVELPPGPIELNTLLLEDYPDNVYIVGAGRDITVLHPQEDISGGQLVIDGQRNRSTTFLMANGDGSDLRLRVHDASKFTPASLVRIRDLSTDMQGNGSWPYDPRPGLYNGEYLRVHTVDILNDELHLVTPVQSSQNYRVRATSVDEPGANQGDTAIPLVDTTGYNPGSEVIILLDGTIPHIAKVVAIDGRSLIIDTPLTANSEAGSPVMIHIQVSTHNVAQGVRVADLSIQLTKQDSGGLILSQVDNFSIDRVAVYGAGWSGIWLEGCTNGIVSDFHIEGGEMHTTNTGYGLQTYHCQWINIHDGIVRGQRRTIDLSGEHPSRYIHVHDNILEGSALIERSTVAGTHGTAEYCDFTDNIIMGGQNGGLLIRGNHITVQGNQFVGTHLAAIVLADGAHWHIFGNVLEGRMRWDVDSGGRNVGEFIRLSSPYAQHLISHGNTTYLDRSHLRITGSVQTEPRVWIMDNIIFRVGNRPLVEVAEGVAIRLSVDSRIVNMGTVSAGDGQVLPDHSAVLTWPVVEMSLTPSEEGQP